MSNAQGYPAVNAVAMPSDEELANFLDTIATLSRLGNLQEFCAIPAVIRALKDSASRLRGYGQQIAQATYNNQDIRRYIEEMEKHQKAKTVQPLPQVNAIGKEMAMRPKDAWKAIDDMDGIK